MSETTLALLGIFGSFLGAVIGAVGALLFTEYRERQRLQEKEKQTRWLPLLRTAEALTETFETLTSIYLRPTYVWNDHAWTDSNGVKRPLPSEARDFHELYLLDHPLTPIASFQNLPVDPSARRKSPPAVQGVRARIHELNRATISLYRTAAYLGYAQRVRSELQHDRLKVSRASREATLELLFRVRMELNGTSEQHPGAGVPDDLQDLIGESVWGPDDSIISYYEFRERILAETGWEQFTDLFRFYIEFHLKMDTEVKKTGEALARLCDALERMVEPKKANRRAAELAAESRQA